MNVQREFSVSGLAIGARAQAMKRQGRPVIILGGGEPDFDTPGHNKEAAWTRNPARGYQIYGFGQLPSCLLLRGFVNRDGHHI
jgi:aspartate/methionine/tyrosine aminotransferase